MRRLIPLVLICLFVCWDGIARKSFSQVAIDTSNVGLVAIKKIPVTDCRVVRGCFGSPVDGSVHSWDYRGGVREYPRTASDGVGYAFNNNDGVHITLADEEGFDAVVLRGGAHTRLYADSGSLMEPADVQPLHRFTGYRPVQSVHFPRRVKESKVVLFGSEGGTIADVSFYRIELAESARPLAPPIWIPDGELTVTPPASRFAPESIFLAMKQRYGEEERSAIALQSGAGRTDPIQVTKDEAVHFITDPIQEKTGLAAITLEIAIDVKDSPCMMTVAVQDPLDPRIDLTWFDMMVTGHGTLQLVLDIPDQVLLPGSQVWITLRLDRGATLGGPDGGGLQFRPHLVSVEEALPEAIEHRKRLMKHFFSVLSEPRPWGSYRRQSRDEFYASSPYAAQCPELFMTIDLCHTLAPGDDFVRQYREWIYAAHLDKFSEVTPPPSPPEGVPAWAWYPRLAWLQTRRIAQWWIDERMVPTGEFGGRVGDDSDMYQQYLDLPLFENDGTGAAIKTWAAAMAELADQQNLRGGLNKNSTDALHAYEEGINHLALMAAWFYGDPVYLERCMDSARNIMHLTVRTEDGRRHFRDAESMGARDMEKPRTPAVDGGASPLMWHAALQYAAYNRSPKVLELVREWADSWLRFMRPGHWATDVEVLSGKVVGVQKDRPLYGGYRSQACVFLWLADLTGDTRYVEPFLHYYRQGNAPMPADGFLGDAYCYGFLDSLQPAQLAALARYSPELALYLNNDPQPLIRDAIGEPVSRSPAVASLYDDRRWPDMYTITHQYTDRIFPNLLQQGSVAYLGGFTRRNKFNPAAGVSWEGFGTDYAALVVTNRRDRLQVLVYNHANVPKSGQMRVWALEHGRYRLSTGPDSNGDFTPDRVERSDELELAKADAIALTLAPSCVTLVELRQLERLDPIYARPDLALAAREIEVRDGQMRGIVHNIGAADVAEVVIAVIDASGRVAVRQTLGPLAAPTDLVPKRKPFTIPLSVPPAQGWRVVVDPEGSIPEIYEGNNEAVL